jgi:hypothetical protein
VWVAIGLLVVLVVIGFLIGISGALASVDRALGGVLTQVGGANADVRPLPDHVETVNTSLAGIDAALKPIPSQADRIIAELSTIDGHLSDVDSLLQNTSGTLNSVLSQANSISTTLAAADNPPDGSGVQAIWKRVAVANGVLFPARNDTKNILAGLVEVNGHLSSICDRVGGFPPGSGC